MKAFVQTLKIAGIKLKPKKSKINSSIISGGATKVGRSKLSRSHLAVVGVIAGGFGAYFIYSSFAAVNLYVTPSGTGTTCTSTAPCNLSSAFSKAVTGDSIELAAGDYGTFAGGAKAGVVTIKAAPGLTNDKVKLGFNINTNSNVVIDGVTVTGIATLNTFTKNVTVKNSDFKVSVRIYSQGMDNANILFDNNTHVNSNGDKEGRWKVDGNNAANPKDSGITIQNSLLSGGDSDGARVDGDAAGVKILNNEFSQLTDRNNPDIHADYIQFYSSQRTTIKGNYFHDPVAAPNGISSCSLGQHDGGGGHIIEDNVVAGGSGCYWGMYLRADKGSIVRHNTFAFGQCTAGSCGSIIIDSKRSEGVATSGTVLENNIFTELINDNSGNNLAGTFTATGNLTRSTVAGTNNTIGAPKYLGGANPTKLADYVLASDSPGKGSGSTPDKGARTFKAGVTPVNSGNPTSPAPTLTMTIAPKTLALGESATITWNSTNATSCVALSGDGWTGAKAISGSEVVKPLSVGQQVIYEMSCTGSAGTIKATASIDAVNAPVTTTPTGNCSVNASVSDFSTVVSRATAGQVVCLATGDYGTWTGNINKSITLTKQTGASPNITLNFTNVDGVTIDGLVIKSLFYNRSVKNTTIKNSEFRGFGYIDATNMVNSNNVFDNNTHVNINLPEPVVEFTGKEGALHIGSGFNNPNNSGMGGNSGIVIKNSLFSTGTSDGIRVDDGAAYVQILNNEFTKHTDQGRAIVHSDPIQLNDGNNVTIRGNYFHDPNGVAACSLGQHDGATGTIFENNLVVGGQCSYGMYFRAAQNAKARHNTFVHGTCMGTTCGILWIGSKNSATSGTVYEDNIFTELNQSETAVNFTARNNLTRKAVAGTGNIVGTPVYVGGTGVAAYALQANSPGKSAASDKTIGNDIGVNTATVGRGKGSGQPTTPPAEPPAPTPDTTPPQTAITAPANNATVSGVYTFTASATDNVGVAGVQFRLDNVNVGTEDTTAPYQYSLDTKTKTNGAHTITAIARDSAGNSTSATVVTFTINNTDTTKPAFASGASLSASATSSTQINLSWPAASDNVGVAGYNILRNGNVIAQVNGSTLSYEDKNLVANTQYTYNVQARDQANNVSANLTASATTQAATNPPAGTACTVDATTSTFASAFASAQAQAVICLAEGNYGTFNGGTKSGTVTIKPASGASQARTTMGLNFNSQSNIVIDGLTISSLSFGTNTKNVTVKNSDFKGSARIYSAGMSNSNILLDNNTHVNHNGDKEGRVKVDGNNASTTTDSGITIQNSLIADGDSDGIRVDGDAVGVKILNNEFYGLTDRNDPDIHADFIQFYTSKRTTIKGNYFYNPKGIASCSLGQHDGGAQHVIENNVIVGGECYIGIYLREDTGSKVSHNTFVYGTCMGGEQCGGIRLDGKQRGGSGTTITDNIFTAIDNSGGVASSYTASTNLTRSSVPGTGNIVGTPIYTGGTGVAAYALASNSPGKNGASDKTIGSDIGANTATVGRGKASGQPSEPPAPTPDTTAPTAPSNMSLSALSPTQVKLSWTASTDSSGIAGYNVYRRASNESNFTKINGALVSSCTATASPTACSFDDTTVKADTTYFYQVEALDGATAPNKAISAAVSVKTPPNPVIQDTVSPVVSFQSPANNANVSGTITATAAAYDPPATTNTTGIDKVEFYLDNFTTRKLTDTGADGNYTYSINTLTYNNGQPVTNGIHTITVIAYDKAGNTKTATLAITVDNPDVTPPSPPASVTASIVQPTATVSSGKVTLSWPAAADSSDQQGPAGSGIKGYYVYRGSTVISCQGQTVGQPLAATSCVDASVAPGAYSYSVRSVDNAGLTSTASTSTSATVNPAPGDTTAPEAPTNVKASTTGYYQADISWTASTSSDTIGYNIYKNGSNTKLNSAPITSTSTSDATLSANTTASYRVSAVDAAGNESAKVATTPPSVTTSAIKLGDFVGAPGQKPNGKVELDDIIYFASNYSKKPAELDLNGDGKVDIADFILLSSRYEARR